MAYKDKRDFYIYNKKINKSAIYIYITMYREHLINLRQGSTMQQSHQASTIIFSQQFVVNNLKSPNPSARPHRQDENEVILKPPAHIV